MSKGVNIAIMGATGLVGLELLKVLEVRNFAIKNLKLLASSRSRDKNIVFKGQNYAVEELNHNSFKDVDIVLASIGQDIVKEYADSILKADACLIDNSNAFRMQTDVPLVVCGVNDNAVKNHRGIIANPNCSTSQLVPVLKVLNDVATLKRVIVSTYQSVSGAGIEAIDELKTQVKEFAAGQKVNTKVLQKQIAFNLIPHIDSFMPDGYTKEEVKVINETRKILDLPNLPITCTAVRVPVMIGHSESVTVDLVKDCDLKTITAELNKHELIEVLDDPSCNKYATPLEIANTDPVYVSRIRKDTSSPCGLNLWVVSDNLRIGAALNAVKIAEYLVNNNLLRRSLV